MEGPQEIIISTPYTRELSEAALALFNLFSCLIIVEGLVARSDVALPGWSERCLEIRDWADKQAVELSDFGSAYEETDDGD